MWGREGELELTPNLAARTEHKVQPQLKVKAKSFATCACNDPFRIRSLLCACSLSLRLSHSLVVWLVPARLVVWLFPFPFCTPSTCATVAACCSLLCACSSCRLAFLFQAKKDEAMSEIPACALSLSLSRSLSLSLTV